MPDGAAARLKPSLILAAAMVLDFVMLRME